MLSDKNYLKRVTLFGTLLVIPWECFLILGFTFSMKGNEPFWAWAFMSFAFFLNIPAVVLSWIKPRLAARWILLNIAISVAIGIGFEIKNYMDNPTSSETFLAQALNLFAGSVAAIALLWFAPAAFAFAILTILDISKQQSVKTATQEINLSR